MIKTIRITKAGWIFIALTIMLGFSAVNTGNNLIYLVASGFLSFMGVSGLLGRGNLPKIDTRINLPDEIFADTEIPVGVTLINKRGILPAFLIRVWVHDRYILFPFVNTKSEDTKYTTIVFTERGRKKLKNIHICSVFPFNFFMRCRKIGEDKEIIVLPMPKRCEIDDLMKKDKKFNGQLSSDKKGYESELLSIRDYTKTDPMKYINWKASAKTGELKTKELSSSVQMPVVIDFEETEIKDTEERISCITYMIIKLLKKNIPVGLRIRGSLYKPDVTKQHRLTLLTELALYEKN